MNLLATLGWNEDGFRKVLSAKVAADKKKNVAYASLIRGKHRSKSAQGCTWGS